MEGKETIGFIGGKFLPLHLGHVYAATEAAKKVDKLYVILTSSKNRDKQLCKRDGMMYIPPDIRMSWIGECLRHLRNVDILHIEDDQYDEDYDWEQGAEEIKKAIGKPIDAIFSSEHEYHDRFMRLYPNAKHVVVDAKRENIPISATQVRKDLYSNWDKLPECVKKHFTKRVAIVGTESCGKSTLVEQLAEAFNTNYVHEVGREYCEKHGNQLTPDMFNHIAMEHFLLQEKKARKSNKVLFVDSDAVITQYYLDMYFNERSPVIDEIAKLQKYDLVLYLEPDVPWVEDGLRFAGDEEVRIKNNEKLKKMYQQAGIPFVCISGDYKQRFRKARELVDRLFEDV